MRDPPSGPRLLALARTVLSEELTPLLPPDRQDEARLVAAAMALAEREAAAGDAHFATILSELAAFYQEGPSPSRCAGPSLSLHCGERAGVRGDPADLLRRFAADLRCGAFAAARERAARALLWRLTLARLRLEHPEFLAANGFA
ncbi:MAG TPA: DUF6285 domain-containing protein [Stellaceae bacterium]|nr:DUF6285 domain-containing protein [Stellaceae bacterium]